uniref:Uncharacterized protein n=1 Tax=Globisporangium ultimum (strain ATCC 200006 / CBS 805.95 / DAOM BR144) TaxID=431595 RepID=K3XCK5_GLOUD
MVILKKFKKVNLLMTNRSLSVLEPMLYVDMAFPLSSAIVESGAAAFGIVWFYLPTGGHIFIMFLLLDRFSWNA